MISHMENIICFYLHTDYSLAILATLMQTSDSHYVQDSSLQAGGLSSNIKGAGAVFPSCTSD